MVLGSFTLWQLWMVKGTSGQTPQREQVPQVLIHLRSLKPSFPKGLVAKFPKALPSMPKVAPMNLPKIGQFISKCEWDEAPPLPACRILVLPVLEPIYTISCHTPQDIDRDLGIVNIA